MILNWRTGIFKIKNVKMNMYIPEFNIIVKRSIFHTLYKRFLSSWNMEGVGGGGVEGVQLYMFSQYNFFALNVHIKNKISERIVLYSLSSVFVLWNMLPAHTAVMWRFIKNKTFHSKRQHTVAQKASYLFPKKYSESSLNSVSWNNANKWDTCRMCSCKMWKWQYKWILSIIILSIFSLCHE